MREEIASRGLRLLKITVQLLLLHANTQSFLAALRFLLFFFSCIALVRRFAVVRYPLNRAKCIICMCFVFIDRLTIELFIYFSVTSFTCCNVFIFTSCSSIFFSLFAFSLLFIQLFTSRSFFASTLSFCIWLQTIWLNFYCWQSLFWPTVADFIKCEEGEIFEEIWRKIFLNCVMKIYWITAQKQRLFISSNNGSCKIFWEGALFGIFLSK